MTRRALLASPLLLAAQAKTQLIIIGDDIGAVHAIGEGTILAYQKGILRSANLIVPGPWFLESVSLLKANPGLDCGVHLALTSEWDAVKWRPLTSMPSLTDSNGYLPNLTRYVSAPTVNLAEVERELRAQIEMAKRHVPAISWLSTHMGAAVSTPRLKELTLKLSAEYKMPMQDSVPGMQRLKVPYDKNSTRPERVAGMVKLINGLGPGLWSLLDHPATDTPEMRRVGHPGYENVAEDRAAILHAWTHPDVLAAVKDRSIELTSVGKALLQKG